MTALAWEEGIIKSRLKHTHYWHTKTHTSPYRLHLIKAGSYYACVCWIFKKAVKRTRATRVFHHMPMVLEGSSPRRNHMLSSVNDSKPNSGKGRWSHTFINQYLTHNFSRVTDIILEIKGHHTVASQQSSVAASSGYRPKTCSFNGFFSHPELKIQSLFTHSKPVCLSSVDKYIHK